MKFSIVLLSICFLFFGNSKFKGGTHAIRTGGYVQDIKHANFMVAVKTKRGNDDFICGGSILSETKFVTAAHCLFNITSAIVSLGSLDPYADMIFFDLERDKYVPHPAWHNSAGWDHDIAVGFIPDGLVLNDNVNKLEVDEQRTAYENLQVAAYGYGESNEKPTNNLRWTTTNVMDFQECWNLYENEDNFRILDESFHFCLGFNQNQIDHTGFGDSGGPIIEYGTSKLVGIISATKVGKPDIIIKVAEYKGFLENPRAGDGSSGDGSSPQ